MKDLAELHSQLRPLMFSIAYRMLGTVTEAEDVVQEALLRLHSAPDSIDNPEAYAVTVTTRLAIDQLRSARLRREHYVGPWLPEPLVTGREADDPATTAERASDISLAVLVLLERLSPVERAVFVLREAFRYGYDDIAAVVQRTPANCRQLVRRARTRVHQESRRFEPSKAERDALADRFFRACADGDLEQLERALAEEVTCYADGGGKAAAVRTPVRGRSRVARFLLGLVRYASANQFQIERVLVNGQPGARVADPNGGVLAVLALEVAEGTVQSIFNVVNPDKLRHLATSGGAT
jgi:RNA polymerase sigma-70 factor (TIGR02957 family)